ncbi:MAG: CBS domain-containing protein [Desulfobulbus sp.]|nr:CBS domain-containing protein [Desulfobulbus sp.]
MPVGEICNREVVVAERTTTIVEAARIMRRYHVGDLVVVDEVQGRRVPVGMVTDRDLVVEVIAREQPFASCTVSAVMSATVVCVPETAGVIEAIQLMRSHGVRRVPVVDAGGALVGILAADDLLDLLAEELSALARIAPRGQEREVRSRLP